MSHAQYIWSDPSVLIISAECGPGPFLWRNGGNWCDAEHWHPSFPMSEGLWRQFADWATSFARTDAFMDNWDSGDWDWDAFHAQGLDLSRLLKAEVGDQYRVLYNRPWEDPAFIPHFYLEFLPGGLVAPTNWLTESE